MSGSRTDGRRGGRGSTRPAPGWRDAGRWRAPRPFDARGHEGLLADGPRRAAGRVVSFASNDYLGLTTHPAVVAGARDALERWGAGSGASRLVTGSRPVHHELESALAAWKGTEAAVVTPHRVRRQPVGAVGVRRRAARWSTPTSSTTPRSSTAAGWPGPRCGSTPTATSPRSTRPLAAVRGRPVVVTDTVFSMDGDACDLDGLVDVARRHGALLVLDEAHAVLGPGPRRRPTASTSCGSGPCPRRSGRSAGSWPARGRFVDLLVNRARPYIFTTAPTPADAGAALAALGVRPVGRGRRPCGPGSPTWWPGWPAPSGAGPPVADPAGGHRRRGGGGGRLGGAAGRRACGCRPSARRPVARARRACGSPCRPPTPTSRSTGWSTAWPRAGWPAHAGPATDRGVGSAA